MIALVTTKKRGKLLWAVFQKDFVEKHNIKPGDRLLVEFIKKAPK